MSEPLKPIRYKYKAVIKKSVDIKQYTWPKHLYKDPREAELDIELAIKQFNLMDRLKPGDNIVTFEVMYMPPEGKEKHYCPVFSGLEIHKCEEGRTVYTPYIKEKLTIIERLKQFFSGIKVRR